MDERRTALYRFYDAAGTLLYIGVSLDVRQRWKQHALDKTWWPEVAERTVEWHDSYPKALYAESAAIRAERPLYNIRHNGPHRTPPPPRPVIRQPRWRPNKAFRDAMILTDARRACVSGEAKQIREDAGLALSAVAGSVGVTRATVYGWETGRRRPTGPPALAYAKLLRSLQKAKAA